MRKLLVTFLLLIGGLAYAQEEEKEDVYKPLTLLLSEDGKNYIRFIMWHQLWVATNDISGDADLQLNASVRRSRFLAFAQMSDRFLILTHWGLNSLNDANLSATGKGSSSQLFLHAAWGELKVNNKLYIGAGLHYWNGISRITSASTLNFMTLDNYRQSWATLGLTDQFARHLGVYAKGEIGRLQYQVALNNALTDALGSGGTLVQDVATYDGKRVFPSEANAVQQGYFMYQFKDKESNKLPYRVGTYLGRKDVFNIGAGFYRHGNGTLSLDAAGDTIQHDVMLFAADVFLDKPMGDGAITAYGAAYFNDYGPNYTLGQTYGTGTNLYLSAGYLLPSQSTKLRLQPYVAFGNQNFEAFDNAGNNLNIGLNFFFNGHNSKLTGEFVSSQAGYNGDTAPDRANIIRLQYHIFL